jgi:hypothetical protein
MFLKLTPEQYAKLKKDECLVVFQTARFVYSYNRGMKWHIAENPSFLTGATPTTLLIPSVLVAS